MYGLPPPLNRPQKSDCKCFFYISINSFVCYKAKVPVYTIFFKSALLCLFFFVSGPDLGVLIVQVHYEFLKKMLKLTTLIHISPLQKTHTNNLTIFGLFVRSLRICHSSIPYYHVVYNLSIIEMTVNPPAQQK